MNAVLAPGLRQGFQFNIVRLSALLAVMIAHCFHFIQAQKQMRLARHLLEAFIIQIANHYLQHAHFVLMPMRKLAGMKRRSVHLLHHRVAHLLLSELHEFFARCIDMRKVEAPASADFDVIDGKARRHLGNRFTCGLCHRIHHAREVMHFNDGHAFRNRRNADDGLLRDRISEQLVSDAIDSAITQRRLDEIDRGSGEIRRCPKAFAKFFEILGRHRIRLARLHVYLHAMDTADSRFGSRISGESGHESPCSFKMIRAGLRKPDD